MQHLVKGELGLQTQNWAWFVGIWNYQHFFMKSNKHHEANCLRNSKMVLYYTNIFCRPMLFELLPLVQTTFCTFCRQFDWGCLHYFSKQCYVDDFEMKHARFWVRLQFPLKWIEFYWSTTYHLIQLKSLVELITFSVSGSFILALKKNKLRTCMTVYIIYRLVILILKTACVLRRHLKLLGEKPGGPSPEERELEFKPWATRDTYSNGNYICFNGISI